MTMCEKHRVVVILCDVCASLTVLSAASYENPRENNFRKPWGKIGLS
jgi:hypothetical protein